MTTYQVSKTVTSTRRAVKVVGEHKFFVNGKIVSADAIIECDLFDAACLIGGGRAVDATAAEVEAAGANIIVAPDSGNKLLTGVA